MGDDGDRLHDWKFDAKTETDDAIVDEIYASTGAVLIGKRMFDVGFEPWGDPPPFGMPVFIVTPEAREPLPMQGGTTYTFVTEGIEAAVELARAAAGDKDVGIWGGANIIEEYLKAGLLDEMQIHVIPVLFGDGTRLFEDLGGRRIELKRTSTIDLRGRPISDSPSRRDQRLLDAHGEARSESVFATSTRTKRDLSAIGGTTISSLGATPLITGAS